MSSEAGREERWSRWDAIALAALFTGLVIMIAGTFDRWLDPIVDIGRDLYIPEKILEGKKLYRDFRYEYPPLAPYLLAAITAVTGHSLASYAAVGIGIASATLLTIYSILRRFAGTLAAFAIGLLFVFSNVAGTTGYGSNFLFPYAYAVTFAMLFFLLYGRFAVEYLVRARRPLWYWLAFSFGLLASWCKIEFAFYFVSTFTLLLLITRRETATRRSWIWSIAIAVGAFVAVGLYFRDAGVAHHWLHDNVLARPPLTGSGARTLYSHISGVFNVRKSLKNAAIGTLLVVLYACVLALFSRSRTIGLRAACCAAVAVLLYGVANDRFFNAWTLLQVLIIPLVLGGRLVVARVHKGVSPEAALNIDRREWLTLSAFLVLSVIGSSRIFLNLAPEWFGFVFILPAYVVIGYVLFRFLPAAGVYSRAASWLWLPLLVAIAATNAAFDHERAAARKYRVTTSRGTFFDHYRDRAIVLQRFLDEAPRLRPATLLVMPEGLTLNYFLRIDNPITFHTFIPGEIDDPVTETRIVAEIEERRPQMVAILPRDVTEFGYRAFGVDYGRSIAADVKRHYRPLKVWRSHGFFILLLERAAGG
jgi:hypothetical protein